MVDSLCNDSERRKAKQNGNKDEENQKQITADGTEQLTKKTNAGSTVL